jgi:hypothetical protein
MVRAQNVVEPRQDDVEVTDACCWHCDTVDSKFNEIIQFGSQSLIPVAGEDRHLSNTPSLQRLSKIYLTFI